MTLELDTPPHEKNSPNGFQRGRSSERRPSSKAACQPPSKASLICTRALTPVSLLFSLQPMLEIFRATFTNEWSGKLLVEVKADDEEKSKL